MLESNKQRSARKKREALKLLEIESRFAPYGLPFEDEPVVQTSVKKTTLPEQKGWFADMTIGWAAAIFLLVLVVI